jgi:PKD repeat protein
MLYRIGIDIPVETDIYKDGNWVNDGNGNLVYTIHFTSAGAQALNLSFDAFTLPEKAELRIYNPITHQMVGPYTSDYNSEDGLMTTGNVLGENLILELIIPENAMGNLQLHVSQLGYFYRSANPKTVLEAKNVGDSESCEVNAACSEGAAWTNQRRGVAMVQVKEGGAYGLCSGTVINNTANDCTPYFLLAQHCGSAASAADFRAWTFYFKYESTGCSNPGTEPTTSNITGSLKLASSGTISDVQKSDFLLVLLKTRPAVAADAYYNGWNRNNTATAGGVGIHHPAGDIKKISTYTATPTSNTWDGTPNSHWRLSWVATANGHGVTEGGSSGSPLFNSAGLIIGDLSGGSSYCTSPNSPDLYGKFSYSWNSCGSTAQTQLAPWLDRGNVGSTTLTGKNNSACNTGTLPVVDFNASNVYPLVNSEVVTMNDATTNTPFIWQWTISGPGTVTYTNGTNAYSQNPQVTFSAVGNYTAILYAGNNAGYASKTKAAYIHVGNVGIENENENPIIMYPNPASDVLYINLGNNVWDLEKTTVTMMDLTGKYVLVERAATSFANTLSIAIPSNIATGFYMVQVSDGKNSTTEKLEIIK